MPKVSLLSCQKKVAFSSNIKNPPERHDIWQHFLLLSHCSYKPFNRLEILFRCSPMTGVACDCPIDTAS